PSERPVRTGPWQRPAAGWQVHLPAGPRRPARPQAAVLRAVNRSERYAKPRHFADTPPYLDWRGHRGPRHAATPKLRPHWSEPRPGPTSSWRPGVRKVVVRALSA